MIELLPETGGGIVAVRMAGTVTEEEQDRYFDQVAALLDRERIECLMMDWSDLEGWAKGARQAGTWFGLHHRAMVARIAIIAEERWEDDILRQSDIFSGATVLRFAPGEQDKALDWLKAGTNA